MHDALCHSHTNRHAMPDAGWTPASHVVHKQSGLLLHLAGREECLPPHVVGSCLAGRQQVQHVQLVQGVNQVTGGHTTLGAQGRGQRQQRAVLVTDATAYDASAYDASACGVCRIEW